MLHEAEPTEGHLNDMDLLWLFENRISNHSYAVCMVAVEGRASFSIFMVLAIEGYGL